MSEELPKLGCVAKMIGWGALLSQCASTKLPTFSGRL